jgi:hypothetical protein
METDSQTRSQWRLKRAFLSLQIWTERRVYACFEKFNLFGSLCNPIKHIRIPG